LILAAETWAKTAKKALKGYVAGHGPVSVNGVVWDNRPITERKYPLDAVLKILELRGQMGAFEPDAGRLRAFASTLRQAGYPLAAGVLDSYLYLIEECTKEEAWRRIKILRHAMIVTPDPRNKVTQKGLKFKLWYDLII
jgi:hypothetical protein